MYVQFNQSNPWRELSRLQHEMNRLFDYYGPATRRAFPAINLMSNNETAILTAELPGLQTDDIKLSVIGRELILEGDRKPESATEGQSVHRQERDFGSFKRSVELPFPVSAEKVAAKFTNGVLTVQLPRAEEDKPKKIEIQTQA